MTFHEMHQLHFHPLETERLILRPFRIEDTEAMFAYTSKPESFTFLRGNAHQEIQQTQSFLARAVAAYEEHSDFLWGICKKETGKLIGSCRLFDFHMEDCRCEVSYLIAPEYHGQGIASEVVGRLKRYVFDELDFVRLQARCVVGNIGSERVMQKCGMEKEGILRKYAKFHNIYQDFCVYAVLKENRK